MLEQEEEQFAEQGYSQDQIEEILLGRQGGVDTSLYSDPSFFALEMRQIRLGLLEQLPVKIYASPQFDWFQMEEIRKGLLNKIDVSSYANPDIPYDKMRQIRLGLEEGCDLSPYIQYNAGILCQYRMSKQSGVNLEPYMERGYDTEQLEQIRLALEEGIALDPYLSTDYRGAALQEIRKGLRDGLDVSQYASTQYSWRMMREIRLGLRHQIDITVYNSTYYSWNQMHEIRLGLEQGLDVSEYRKLRYPADEMRRQRLLLLKAAESDSLYEGTQAESILAEDYSLTFSTGNMEAYLTFHGNRSALTIASLTALLKQNNICHGILVDGLNSILDGSDNQEPVLVARGDAPQMGPNGWYEYFFRTMLEKKPRVLEDGTVDYQNVDWFETVKAGQKLAYYHEAQPGIDGHTVTGEVIKARKGIDQSILTGTGFYMSEDKKTYYSQMDGKIQLIGTSMTISRYMEVDDVTMATGNIRFDGSVRIRGNVGNGVIIDVADDLVIDGNVDGAKISCGGTILLKKGMNASGHGYIKATGNIVSKFFEAVKVESNADIRVNRSLNSQLYAKGTIFSSLALTGGVAQAGNGMQLYNTGNNVGLHTVLKIQQDQALLNQLYKINETRKEVDHELSILQRSHDDIIKKFKPEVYNTMDLYLKLEDAIYTKKKQQTDLNLLYEKTDVLIRRSKEAKIVITGEAFEGTIININGIRWSADNRYNITAHIVNGEMSVYTNSPND
jgi:uncharacterized protein (DUF342 family)